MIEIVKTIESNVKALENANEKCYYVAYSIHEVLMIIFAETGYVAYNPENNECMYDGSGLTLEECINSLIDDGYKVYEFNTTKKQLEFVLSNLK